MPRTEESVSSIDLSCCIVLFHRSTSDLAEAVERTLAGRTGVYDVTVRDSAGNTIALFRGKSYRISGEVIAGLAAEKA